MKYNANNNKKYFDNVYGKAVYLFANVLKQVGGKASEILCHSEGYQAGIASNHADVLHWFPEHGKTMDDFRADVEKAMDVSTSANTGNTLANQIKQAQTMLNNKFNSGLAIDGSWGPSSKKALIKAIQQSINTIYNGKLSVDGPWGPASVKACPNLKYYVKNDLVYCLQLGLYAKGFAIDVDGSYGHGTESVVKQYQTFCGITSDGEAGPTTFTKVVS